LRSIDSIKLNLNPILIINTIHHRKYHHELTLSTGFGLH